MRVRGIIATLRGHPRHVALFAAAAAMTAGVWAPAALPAVLAAAVWLAPSRSAAAAMLVAVAAAVLVADARRDAVDGGTLPARLGEAITIEAVVLEPLRTRATGTAVARVAMASGPGAGDPLLLRLRPELASPALDVGASVRIRGRLVALAPFEILQRRRGAIGAIDAVDVAPTGRRRGGPAGALDGVRRRAETALGAGVALDRAALVRGMVLGRDEGIARSVREDWERSGLAHLLAASGSNVMLLATLVLALGALAGAPLRARLGAALALVALYVPVAGAGPSIQRAGVMGAAGLLAALAGRPASRWYALGLAAVVTQAVHPYAAGEPGWQLSFAAVVGLLAWVPRLRDRLVRAGVPGPVAEVAALTVAATVATAPLMVVHFQRLSLVALAANLAAAPAVAPVMWLGTLASLAAQAGLHAVPLSWAAGAGAAYVGAVAAFAADLPAASISVRAGTGAVAAGAAAVGATWLAWRGGGGARLRRWTARPGRTVPALAVAGLATLFIGLALLSGPTAVAPPRPGETVVSFLDVGQGDATLVRRDGAAVLFDTGPSGGPVLDRLRREGVTRLDALVITHAQDDHEGAALEIVRRARPRLIVNGGVGWPTRVQRALGPAARRAGSRVIEVAAGDALRVGRLAMRFLWPPRALLHAPPEGDPNDRALVAHVSSGAFDLLLPADAESHVTAPLRLPAVEALKVAHHGSADPGLPALLERVRPVVAAIEVGRGNRYGHPTASTLTALRSVPYVRRTDRDGTVRLRAASGRLELESERRLR